VINRETKNHFKTGKYIESRKEIISNHEIIINSETKIISNHENIIKNIANKKL
jgi:hypothetical protein